MSSPKFWSRLRKPKNNKASSSPPDRIPYDHEEEDAGLPSASMASSLSTFNSAGFYSTPPSYHVDDNSSPLSISPNTPRKEWEVNYKTYLSRAHAVDDDRSGADLSSDASTDQFIGMRVPDLAKYQTTSVVGAARSNEQMAYSLPSHAFSRPTRHRLRSDQGILYHATASKVSVKAGEVAHGGVGVGVGGVDSDDSSKSYSSNRGIRFKDAPTSLTNADEPGHGSNFFHHPFRHKKKEKMDKSSTVTESEKIKNRTKSCGSLDVAMRNGIETEIFIDGIERRTRSAKSGLFQPGVVIAPRIQQRGFIARKKKDKERQQKLAFTQYHNSHQYAADTTAPYLGDEKSVQGERRSANMERLDDDIAPESTAVSEEVGAAKTILTPVEGPEKWIEKRRYLMAPAIMAICPSQVYSLFQNEPNFSDNNFFGKIDLGSAEVAQIVSKGLLEENYKWSSGNFVLRQNYLLEYDEVQYSNSRPKGYAFLQNASIRKNEHFHDTLRLDYYQPETSTRRSILIRLACEEDREQWYASLSEAARLKIEDLYEYDATGLGEVLGRGRFATVYPGRRRRKRDDGISNGSSDDNFKVLSKGGSGILKKKPSFTSFNNMAVPLTKDDYECALKVIDKHKFWDRVRKDQERADSIVRETSVQAALLANGNIYPGFLRVKSFFETLDKVVLELELLEGTDLFRYISSKENISEVEAAHIMYDVLRCLDAMKAIGIAHRDIKPANILMANRGDESGISVKLGDFGMATFVGKDNLVRGRCGTPGYVAPEILEAMKNGGYENTVDMFSAGVLMYILLCGYEPFSYAESEKELINENRKAKVEYPDADWLSVSIEGRDLVEKMLERDPLKRIEPKKALQHPWITRRATQSKLKQDATRTESLNDFACSIS